MLEQFERVVAQHKNLVYSFAYYYLGNPAEAEDVTQEVLLKLWNHWDRLDLDSIPKWLNRVTRNASVDQLRRRRAYRRVVADEAAPEVAERAVDHGRDPLTRAESAAFSEHLRVALAKLPEPYRSALVLREIRELKYREISDLLEIPVNTVKTHVHRGRRMLREILREVLGDVVADRACLH